MERQDDGAVVHAGSIQQTLVIEKEILDMNEEHCRLPPENVTKEINKSTFTIHPQSQTAFVIERSEDKITDYYFESPHTSHQKTLKEDISSLLSYLK